MSQSATVWRKQLREAIQKRGRRKFDVWTGYASKGKFYFSIDGTPNFLHLIWMEGDPDVVSYTIPSEKEVGEGLEGPQGTIPDAICQLRNGQVEWREIKTEHEAARVRKKSSDQVLIQSALAEKYQVNWRLITTADLDRNRTLINNWREGLSYIWACLPFDLTPYEYSVAAIVSNGPRTVNQVVTAYQPDKEPFLLAAIFRLIQKGEIEANLSKRPFSLATTLLPRVTQ